MKPQFVYLEDAARAPAIEAHWREWHSSRPREAHYAYVERAMASAWGRRAWRVAGLRDKSGSVLATAYVYDLHYRLGSQRLRVGGVAAFCVRPDLRGLGLGTQLLQALHAHLRAEEFDGAALYSRIGREYYERLGYLRMPQRAVEAELVDGVDPRFDASPSLLREYEERDFAGVRNIYNTSSALQRWAFLREDEYWLHRIESQQLRSRLFPRGQSRPLFLVGEREGHIVSYLRATMSPEGELLHLLEYGFEPGARDDVPALVSRAARECAPAQPKRARALAPTRLANLLPARAPTWHSERRSIFMLKSFGGFEVPAEVPQDERLVWASDTF